MPTNPQIDRQIRELENMKRDRLRSIQQTDQSRKALERQLSEAKRLPNTSSVQNQLNNTIRQYQRTADQCRSEIRTFERQIGELRRMNR